MSAIEHVFGANAEIHPVTGRPIETGIGALPVDRQAELHIADVEREEGVETADEMRRQLGIPTQTEIATAAKAKAEEERQREAHLDEWESALAEREADLDAREQAVTEREKATFLKPGHVMADPVLLEHHDDVPPSPIAMPPGMIEKFRNE